MKTELPQTSQYRPKLTRTELVAENATNVARAMTEADTAARNAKTERLRTARLQREAEEAAQIKNKQNRAKTSRKRIKT